MHTRLKKYEALALQMSRRAGLCLLFCCLGSGCAFLNKADKPTIAFTRVPPAGEGGPDKLDDIAGRVNGAQTGQKIALYAKAGSIWYIQPLASEPLTAISPDATWKNATHLGTQYAAILVGPGYDPPLTVKELPSVGGKVYAVTTANVGPAPETVNQTLKFGGYDWYIRHIPGVRDGAVAYYDPANAWTDGDGHLHLRITRLKDRTLCSQVALARHLGYGTFRFTTRDTSHLEPATVLVMLTYDDLAAENHREMDLELSQWGDPKNKNGDYVVQPYYFPENKVLFQAPPGMLTHSLIWEPGRATFETFRGTDPAASSVPVAKNVFSTGVPSTGGEAIVFDFCDFKFSKVPLHNGSEVVIEKFQYLP